MFPRALQRKRALKAFKIACAEKTRTELAAYGMFL
jgi:hypothetical protein